MTDIYMRILTYCFYQLNSSKGQSFSQMILVQFSLLAHGLCLLAALQPMKSQFQAGSHGYAFTPC